MKTRSARIAAGCALAAAVFGLPPVAQADDSVDVGAKVLAPEAIKQGLFPEDECEQLKQAGFKCMGFKPPVRFSLPAVSFKVGSADLPDLVKQQLDGFAEVLRTRQSVDRKVRIEGHADASGDTAANQELSQRRAEAAKQYLVSKGVNPELVTTVGMGAKAPKDAKNPLSSENRRVVIGRDSEPK